MCQGFGTSEIVDSDKFNTGIINGRPQHVAPDAAKAIDANFNSPVSIPPVREPEFDADIEQQVQKTARQYVKQFRLADRGNRAQMDTSSLPEKCSLRARDLYQGTTSVVPSRLQPALNKQLKLLFLTAVGWRAAPDFGA